MSWFRTTPQETPDPSQNTDGSYKPLARSEREACWTARDAYFTCLDRNGILDSLKDAEEARRVCGAQEEAFGRDCASSWVKYFKQKRVAEYEKEQKFKKYDAEGALPMAQGQKPWYQVW
ncbi:MAG: hypothetical protein Q9162_007664 [Coniocarpon cinnabarinum]